jgi:hypothetical protein
MRLRVREYKNLIVSRRAGRDENDNVYVIEIMK